MTTEDAEYTEGKGTEKFFFCVFYDFEPLGMARRNAGIHGADGDYTAVGSPADLDFTIEHLPANSAVDVVVTAVNNGGESIVIGSDYHHHSRLTDAEIA